jgi:hypothetical protein
MAKSSGLGQALFVQGYDLSTDASTLSGAGYTQEVLDTTGIDVSAPQHWLSTGGLIMQTIRPMRPISHFQLETGL